VSVEEEEAKVEEEVMMIIIMMTMMMMMIMMIGESEEDMEEILIVYEDVLVLQCMGPADNEMYQKIIRVHKEGAAGGRRRVTR